MVQICLTEVRIAPHFLPVSARLSPRRAPALLTPMVALLLLAPLFLVFEVAQLVLCERYLGVKQIARGADPRSLGPGERVAMLWTLLLASYAGWVLVLAAVGLTRVHGLGLLLVTAIGFSLRRGAKMQWILVILTFEGAIRIGLLISLCAALWRRL